MLDQAVVTPIKVKKPPKPFTGITPVYDILLRGSKEMPIGLYHLYKASAAQLTRLHYSENTVKLVKKRLRTLADHEYIEFDDTPTKQYRSPYYYVLGNKGIEYVKSIGFGVGKSYRPGKEIGQSYLHLLHKLGVNDVLISAALLKYKAPGYHLEAFEFERELGREPFHALWHGEPYKLVPDLFLDLRHLLDNGRQERTPVLVEHDRGTESEEVIRRKIHAYSAMIADEWYKQRFGVNSIRVTFVTFEGERERDKLRAWAMRELQGAGREVISSFLFTAQSKAPDSQRMWLNPCWYTPFMEDKPVTILGE
jgi:hypothetical protein